MPGSQIGPYRIVSKIGEGGMGAVYRATDSKLNREVAIKILPPGFAQDTARMQRFEREAQMLASLNHPNIATIHSVEQGAIVMELVEGEDLKGPLPFDTAIGYARQIASGLEAAHEKGIIHRDLKPANIKVTPDGAVKLLDFGLAKTSEANSAAAAGSGSPTFSPTLSLEMTQTGAILGTAAYMSPEQARGKPVDRRADIWAFGVVLYEMLTGDSPFGGGETASDAMAAVIAREPDWSRLPKETPLHIRRLLERCLRKDPKQRLRDIGDARLMLDDAEPEAQPAASRAGKLAWLPWVVALLAIGAAGVAWFRPKPAEPVTVRFPLFLPEGALDPGSPATPQFVPSPDGRYIAFTANFNGAQSLWVRPMGSPTAQRLDKAEDANYPFWSPDGQFIAYFTRDKLMRIPAGGGSPHTICDTQTAQRQSMPGDGGTWNADGTIVFAEGNGYSLRRVPAGGGVVTPVTKLDASAGELRHSWPQFLPDGRHLLYFSQNSDPEKSAIYVQELGSDQRTLVMRNPLRAAWSPPGYLLFARDGTLFAQRMDPKSFRLAAEPLSIAEDVSSNNTNGRSSFAVSSNGILLYRTGAVQMTGQLAWYERDGKRLGAIGQPDTYQNVRLSSEDRRAAVVIGGGGHADLWIIDLANGVPARMTNIGDVSAWAGPWSPDSQHIAVNLLRSGGLLDVTVASGNVKPLGKGFYAEDWFQDGRSLVCRNYEGTQVMTLSLENGSVPQTVNSTPSNKRNFRLSPDGKWVAYSSTESGREQVFLASFPTFAEKRPITDGGFPSWRKDGRELYFVSPDGRLTALEMGIGGNPTGAAKPLFKVGLSSALGYHYSPSADGKRFLVIESPATRPPEVMVVVNWPAELKGQ